VWDKAVTYRQQAGARANARAAPREAVAFFEQALQALAHLPEDGDTQVRALDLRLAVDPPLVALGEPRRCLVLLVEAEALARALADRVRLGRVLARMAYVRRVTGDANGAIAAGQQALALAAALGDSAMGVAASLHLGVAYADLGDFGRSATLLRRSVEAADKEPDTPSTHMRIQSRAWLARTLGILGAFTAGRRHGEEALRLATLEGRGSMPILAYSSLGLLYLTKGDLEPASRMFEQSLALCRASGQRDFFHAITAGLGSVYALQGRLTEGRALLEEATSDSLHRGVLAGHAFRVAWFSEVCRLAGYSAEAWQHACEALDLARQHKERANEALALHQLGVVYAHADPPEVALAEADYQQALALAEELDMRPLVAHCHLGLGRLYCQAGRGEQARVALATAIELYRAMDMSFWLLQAEAALARTCMAS
jgi:tetratricopeptide (TPR) repeat protein